jgi:hypothetical protein
LYFFHTPTFCHSCPGPLYLTISPSQHPPSFSLLFLLLFCPFLTASAAATSPSAWKNTWQKKATGRRRGSGPPLCSASQS